MKRFFPVFIVLGLVACDNTAEIKVNADSTIKDIKTSPTLDSLGNKVEQIGDTIGAKTERTFDTIKAKGSRLLNKAGDKIDNIKITKDSVTKN